MDAGIIRESVKSDDYAGILELVQREGIGFVVIGPDQALADGLVDKLQEIQVPAFGPSAAAARIEASKAYSKKLMEQEGIPTARFAVFEDLEKAKEFLDTCEWDSGWAIKADGLALGKGVVVTSDKQEAHECLQSFLVDGDMGDAGRTIIIEERLVGKEVSGFFICDGTNSQSLGFACDYKQIYNGGEGPNTGGMGAYSPVEWLPANFSEIIKATAVTPLLNAMKKEGNPFKGMLFIGMINTNSGPKVLEFNARFGDPETQAIMPLMDSDLFPVLRASVDGTLDRLGATTIRMKRKSSVHVVMAASGYPGTGGRTVKKRRSH